MEDQKSTNLGGWMNKRIKAKFLNKKRLKQRKAQFYSAEIVIAALLIVSVILILQMIQIAPNRVSIQRIELKERGWNALATSDELDLLRPAVYSGNEQTKSTDIQTLNEFLLLILITNLDYMLDVTNQTSYDTWNLIGGESASEQIENQNIVRVNYLILGPLPSTTTPLIIDPVVVTLSLWEIRS